MPRSMARWIVAIDSPSSAGPYDWLMPMQPSPMAETSRVPRRRVFMGWSVSLPHRQLPHRLARSAGNRGGDAIVDLAGILDLDGIAQADLDAVRGDAQAAVRAPRRRGDVQQPVHLAGLPVDPIAVLAAHPLYRRQHARLQ